MKQKNIEILVGLAIIITAFILCMLGYNKVGRRNNIKNHYNVTASFSNIDGINDNANVSISGINVGYVTSIKLNPNTFDAILDISINDDIKIPDDSRARIVTSGLFGNKYIDIQPGVSQQLLHNGSQFRSTQSAINIESLIDKIVYSKTTNGEK